MIVIEDSLESSIYWSALIDVSHMIIHVYSIIVWTL